MYFGSVSQASSFYLSVPSGSSARTTRTSGQYTMELVQHRGQKPYYKGPESYHFWILRNTVIVELLDVAFACNKSSQFFNEKIKMNEKVTSCPIKSNKK